VGGLALAALFAAEISTADAVLFMLATSLSRDLFQAVLRPKATDAELLRVGRLAAAVGGGLGVLLALVLPSVASALKLFYGVMTAALFMPLMVGLLSARPGAAHARVAIGASVLTTSGLVLALAGTPLGAWLPSVAGVGAAGLVFATAWLGAKDERPGGGGVPPAGPGAT
jgi:SSS family solute:Na+ symporter